MFLRNTFSPSSLTNTILDVPAIHLGVAKAGMNELRKRLGDLRVNAPEHENDLWVRTYAEYLKISDHTKTYMTPVGIEIGYDHRVYSDANNSMYIGAMAGYMQADRIKTEQRNGYTAMGDGNAPSVGLYATWQSDCGWFMDAVLRHFWSSVNTEAYTSQGNAISLDNDRGMTAASFEIGFQEYLGGGFKTGWFVEPKIELGYIHANSHAFETGGKRVTYSTTNSLTISPRVMVSYAQMTPFNNIIEPFVQLGFTTEFDGKTRTTFDGAHFKSDVGGTTYEIAGGLNARLNGNTHIYMDTTFETGNVYQAISGNMGVRYAF